MLCRAHLWLCLQLSTIPGLAFVLKRIVYPSAVFCAVFCIVVVGLTLVAVVALSHCIVMHCATGSGNATRHSGTQRLAGWPTTKSVLPGDWPGIVAGRVFWQR